MKTAILVDGGFFLKRYHYIKGFDREDTPQVVAKNLVDYCMRHIQRVNGYRKRYGLPLTELYRVYFYDAKPFDGDAKNPISGKQISFKKTPQYNFRNDLFTELKQSRKIALRLGFLKNTSREWLIRGRHTKPLLKGEITIDDLTPDDLDYRLNQKAVDMKIGLDIATLAFKSQVEQIILIAGDSDFVPAAKFARREGVDVVLDPMLNKVDPSLHEHIDGMTTIKNMGTRDDKDEHSPKMEKEQTVVETIEEIPKPKSYSEDFSKRVPKRKGN